MVRNSIATGLTGMLVYLVMSGTALAGYQMPRNLQQGWDGKVQLGALATFGATDSSAVSARTDFTYRGARLEHEITTKVYRSSSESLVTRRNAQGEEIRDEDGLPVRDMVKSTTNDRRFISVQPRWFFTSVHYAFLLADAEFNEPADIESSTRQVAGVGYKLWKSRRDFISAAVGVGRKKLVQVSGESEEGAIGYVGLRLNRRLNDKIAVALDFDSDFGGRNRFSEAEASLSWKVRGPVAVKFKYEARFNSNFVNPWNTFDAGVEAAMSVNLEIEIF